VREKIAAKIKRGKLEVSLKLQALTAEPEPQVLDQSVLQQLNYAIDEVKALRSDISLIDPLAILQWPGMLVSHPHSQSTQTAMTGFDKALEDFVLTRKREGQQMAKLLSARLSQLEGQLSQLRINRPEVVKHQREKLLAKLSQLDIEHNEARLEQELVYSAQRLDIDEELDRLDAHIAEFADVLERNEPVGRRLDFLLQEFNREANTIATKSSDNATTTASVELKVVIEQMREQVQNLE